VSRRGLTVGELAKRTGVSVRTLHHYEAIGLLAPANRTKAGYRLYGQADVAQLQQVLSLRQLGFGLDQIREFLKRRDASPLQIIEMHLSELRRQIDAQERLCARLEAIAAGLRANGTVSVDDLLNTIEEITKVERYYTPEQLAEIQERGRQLGEEGLRRAEANWQQLIDEVRAELERGTDPTSERVRALAARWQALIASFTGGNPEIAGALNTMWQQEEEIHGMNTAEMRKLGEYVSKAMASPQSA
jgi:DNA-binding transcriptional MerR regulator